MSDERLWPVIDVLLLPVRAWLWFRDYVLNPWNPEGSA